MVSALSCRIRAGDADLGGGFGITDLLVVIDWLVGRVKMPTSGHAAFLAADVDGDGKISLVDIQWMIHKQVGLIDRFPVE